MVQEYGKEAVDAVVESVRKRNGSVHNPTGYVIDAFKKGYNPKTPEQIAQEKNRERSKRIDKEIEESLIERKKLEEESDKCDREFANKTVQDFLSNLKD